METRASLPAASTNEHSAGNAIGRRISGAFLPLTMIGLVVLSGCSTRWSDRSCNQVVDALAESYRQARRWKDANGSWPSNWRQIAPLARHATGKGLVRFGRRTYIVTYSPGLDRYFSWQSLVTLRRVDGGMGSLFGWEETYAVNKRGRVAMGEGYSAEWVPMAIMVVALVLFPAVALAILRRTK